MKASVTRVVTTKTRTVGLVYHNATATPASTTGRDQAQSPRFVTAAAATTQPPKKPSRRRREAHNRAVSLAVGGFAPPNRVQQRQHGVRQLPVMTALEGATGKAKRKRAN